MKFQSKTVDLRSLLGIIKPKVHKVTVEDMKQTIRKVGSSVRISPSSNCRGQGRDQTPLPALAEPAPVAGVDLDDTSRLWEVE